MATLQNSAICMGSIRDSFSRGCPCTPDLEGRDPLRVRSPQFPPLQTTLPFRARLRAIKFIFEFLSFITYFSKIKVPHLVFLVLHLLFLGGACLAWIPLANASTAGIGGAVGKKLHPCNFFP